MKTFQQRIDEIADAIEIGSISIADAKKCIQHLRWIIASDEGTDDEAYQILIDQIIFIQEKLNT